ncbi:MAG: hypothetical protein GY853_05200 [PVC group bacterium]|nr:hypothetical protein [PVC group bacterium]
MIKTIIKIWKDGISFVFKHPSIITPFLLLAIMEAIWLSMSYYAPRPPISIIYAPLIKAFMGEKMVLYPYNFLVLPQLVFIGRVLGYLTVGLISLGMTAVGVVQISTEESGIRFFGNLNRALRRYPALLGVGVLYGLLSMIVYKIPRVIIGNFFSQSSYAQVLIIVVFISSFLLMVLLEMILIYAPLFILVLRQGIFSAVKNSFSFCLKFFMPTLTFVLFFRILNLLMILLKNDFRQLIFTKFAHFPEIAVVILGSDIVVLFSSHLFITVLAARLFLTSREKHDV